MNAADSAKLLDHQGFYLHCRTYHGVTKVPQLRSLCSWDSGPLQSYAMSLLHGFASRSRSPAPTCLTKARVYKLYAEHCNSNHLDRRLGLAVDIGLQPE